MSNNPDLGKCDMVLAISEDMINYQFECLFDMDVIRRDWNITLQEDDEGEIKDVKINLPQTDYENLVTKGDYWYTFGARIKSPVIKILENERKILSVFIQFEFGTLRYYKGSGQKRTPTAVDMSEWAYAFKVQIGSIEHTAADCQWLTPGSRKQFEDFCSDTALGPEQFTIESLFLDFTNANYADYDRKSSKVPLDIRGLSIFQDLLSNYFKRLAGTDNPFVLGYGIKVKQLSGQAKALFHPTALQYSTSYNTNPALRAFNFLMMVDGSKFPDSPDSGSIQSLLSKSDSSIDGTLCIDAELWFKKTAGLLDLHSIISKALKALADNKSLEINKNKSNFFGGQRVELKTKFTDGQIEQSKSNLWSASKKPYQLIVEGDSSTSTMGNYISRSVKHTTLVCPLVRFFTKKLDCEEIKISEISFPAFSASTDATLGLGFLLMVDTEQTSNIWGSDMMMPINERGYIRYKTPFRILCDIKAGGTGQAIVSSSIHEGISDSKTISADGGTGIGAASECIYTTLKEKLSDIENAIKLSLDNISNVKVIFPLSEIYAFKDLRFRKDPNGPASENNFVMMDAAYALTAHEPAKNGTL